MPVLMELQKIIITETQEEQVIVLREVDGERFFPIIIGTKEARAIEKRLKGIVERRPMTHDLLASVVEKLGGKVERIDITDLHDRTFFAQLVIRQDGQLIEVDSRPSDAIALGIATTVPIYVAAHVLNEVYRDQQKFE